MNRQEWLEARKAGIGGTDAAAVLGLSPYRTAVDVWEDKLGLAPDREVTAAMQWGTRLEDAVADAYTAETGRKLRRVNGIRWARSIRSFPLFGSIDRLADTDRRVIELKTARSAERLGDPEGPVYQRVPPDWYAQTQVYLVVTGWDVADVAVLVGGSDFRVIEVPRDQSFIDDMLPELQAFWTTNVKGRVQPEVTGGDLAFLARRYPKDSGSEVVATSEVALLVEQYARTQARRDAEERSLDELRAKIEAAMGESSRLVAPAATVSWKAHERTAVAWKEYAGVLRNAYLSLHTAIGEAGLEDEVPGPWVDPDAVQSLYTTTSTVRPFRVDVRKEDA